MKGAYNNLGTIYVLQNKAMKGLYKIGITERDVKLRISELSRSSGVPHPFELVYSYPVANCKEAERALHKAFDKQRSNKNREFFKINPQDIKPLIEFISKNTVLNQKEAKKETSYKTQDKQPKDKAKLLSQSIIERAKLNFEIQRQMQSMQQRPTQQSARPKISDNNYRRQEEGVSLSERNPHRFNNPNNFNPRRF